MTLDPNELLVSRSTSEWPAIAAERDGVIDGFFGAVSGGATLAVGTALAFDPTTEKWKAWDGLAGSTANEKQLITINNATGGTFTLTFDDTGANPQTTAAIAYNAAASAVETAFEALSNVGAGNGTVTGSAGGPYTIEFTGSLAATPVPQVTADASSLTHATETPSIDIDTIQQGQDAATDTNVIKGFVYPKDIVLDDSGDTNYDVRGLVMVKGTIHRDAVPLPSGVTRAELDERLEQDLRALGIIVQGLNKVR